MRRAGLTLVTLAVTLSAWAAFGVSSAAASPSTPVRPNAAFDASGALTPDAWAEIQNPTIFPPPVGADGLNQSDIDPVINEARVRGGILPRLRSITGNTGFALKTGLYSAAVSLGLTGYTDLFQLLTGSDIGTTAPASTSLAAASPYEWHYHTAGHCINMSADTGTVAGGQCTSVHAVTAGGDGWYLTWKECSGSGCTPTALSYVFSAPGTGIGALIAALMPHLGAPRLMALGSGSYGWYATDDEFEHAVPRKQITQNTYNNQTTRFGPFTFTPGDAGAPDLTPAAIPYGTPGSQTDPQKGAENALVVNIAGSPTSVTVPGTVTTFQPFVLPRPAADESYADYVDRLRALGWLGAVTLTADSMGYPTGTPARALQPGTVTRVTTASTPQDAYAPSTGERTDWQGAPQVSTPTQPVTIQKVPPTYTPEEANTQLHWPSIENPCTKFPFGVFCWITDAVASMVTAEPVAPHLDLAEMTVPLGGAPGMPDELATPAIHLGAEEFPDVVVTGFDVIAFCVVFWIWLHGLWFVGSRLMLGPGKTLEGGGAAE